MPAPRTDREELQQLRARVAELEEELAAYRAIEEGEAADEAREVRIYRANLRLQKILRSIGWKGGRQRGAAIMALLMLDAPGRLLSKERAARLTSPSGEPRELKLGDVYACILRKALAAHGLNGAVTTVWGRGWIMEPAHADAVRALLEPAHG